MDGLGQQRQSGTAFLEGKAGVSFWKGEEGVGEGVGAGVGAGVGVGVGGGSTAAADDDSFYGDDVTRVCDEDDDDDDDDETRKEDAEDVASLNGARSRKINTFLQQEAQLAKKRSRADVFQRSKGSRRHLVGGRGGADDRNEEIKQAIRAARVFPPAEGKGTLQPNASQPAVNPFSGRGMRLSAARKASASAEGAE
jgi:hypothetical protein